MNRVWKYTAMLLMVLTLGVGEMKAENYILGPDGSWDQNAAHTLGASGISNWVYKDLTVTGQWKNFKVLNDGTWYGKDSGGNNVTVGTLYTPTTSGGDNYCDFKASDLTYYFFFNTSTKKLMIQPKYYLAGTCGASDQNWSTTANAPTYDATNGYFKWNTSSLTAGTTYKFKLVTYNSWSYYNYQDGGSVSVSQGTHETTDGDNNIIFTPTYSGTAIITMVPTTNAMVVHCPYQISYNKGANGTGTIASGSKTWKTSFTLSSSTFTRAGYTQDGWSTSDGGAKVYELGGSYTTDADLTLYPHWAENTYSLTFSHNGHGMISVGGATVSSGSTASVNYATTKTLVANPSTGYSFTGWSLSGTNTSAVTIGNTSNASTTIKATNTGATVTAGFSAKTYTITLDDNGSYQGNGSATATYNSSTLSFASHASRTDYRIDGYYAEEGLTTKVINADGTLVANVSDYTGAGGIWTRDANTTLYAKWVYDVTEYKVTFGVGTSYTSLGSLSAYDNTSSTSISSGSNVRSGHSVTFTASPNTGYTVEGWYTNAACTTGKHDAGSLTYTTSIAGAIDVYVKFVEKTWSVTFAAGTGGTVTTPAASPQTVGQLTGISIAATPSTGYAFASWSSSSGGSFTSSASTNSNTFKPTANTTVTASFNETMSSLSTSCHYDAGNPSYSVPSKSTSSIGITTTADLTAAAPGTGYTFAGWTLSSNLVVTSGNSASDRSITVRTDGNGADATAQANYEEDLTTDYVLRGGNAFGYHATDPWGQDHVMTKKSGHSTESVAYYTANITSTNTGNSNDDFKFKIKNGDNWWGLSAEGDQYYFNRNTSTQTLANAKDIELRADAVGEYVFKVDYSDADHPELTITFPPSIALSATDTNILYNGSTSLSVSTEYLPSGSKTIEYEFFEGDNTLPANKIGSTQTFDNVSATTHSSTAQAVTPGFSSSDYTASQIYTAKITVNGTIYTRTITIYRKWDINVRKSPNWSQIKLYEWGANGQNTDYPGALCTNISGAWYTVTLSSKFEGFVLSEDGDATKTTDLDVDDYAEGTSWYVSANSSGTLTAVAAPTVEMRPSDPGTYAVNTNQLRLTAEITSYGGDGTCARDMTEVGFMIGETKYPIPSSCTAEDNGWFWGGITGLTAGTEYTVKAYATNFAGTSVSANTATLTTRAAGTTTIKVRTALADAAPKVYAWTTKDCGGTSTENATYPGASMGDPIITGTTYKWYSYNISNEFNQFIVNNGADVAAADLVKTDDFDNPFTETCYWYAPSENNEEGHKRMGAMSCPYLTPQLMIETTAGGGEFEYLEMSTSPTISKTVTLAAKSTYKFKPIYNSEWYGKADVTLTRASNSVSGLSASIENDLRITTDAAGDYTFTFTAPNTIEVTYPTAYTVTFGAGTLNGSSSAITASATPSFTNGDYVLKTTAVTFSKGTTQTGYAWKGWYSNNDGTGTCHSSTDGNWTSAANTRTGDISVYACYDLVNYTITYNLNGGSNPGSAPTSFTLQSSTVTLPTPTRTGYTFNGWYANSDLSTGGVKTTIAAGSTGDKTYWAKWTAKNYTITLNANGGTGSSPESVTATFDATAPDSDGGDNFLFEDIDNPTKEGYTFAGWNTETDGNGVQIITEYKYYEWNTSYVDNSGHWIHDGDVTVYAKWTPNNYTVTLSTSGETGYGSAAPSNQTATYSAALPTITPPVGAAGYMFQGYFTGTGGTGTKYYNANGTSAKNWDIADAATLHAYFQKAEISSLEHDASVAKADVAYLDVNPVLNVTPADYTAICWTLHYTENDNEVATSGASYYSVAPHAEVGKPNQVRFTLNNMSVGSYYVQAVLKAKASAFSSVCSEGTEFDVKTGEFSIVGNSTVTILYKELTSGAVIASGSSVEIEAGGDADVVAPNIIGYTFNSWSVGAGVTNNDEEGNTINISSPYDGVITAYYTKKQMIYFNNTLGWDTVFVYFYKDGYYWGDRDQGTGANTEYHGGSYTGKYAGMTKIGDSNIYYYDMTANSVTSYTNVAFTELDQNGSDYFYNGNKVIGRGDYSSLLSMYVPLTGVDPVEKNAGYTAYYYEKGYWMNYPDNTGYTLVIYDNTGLSAPIIKQVAIPYSADKRMPMSVTTDLEGGKTYGFEIYRADNRYYGNSGTMTNGHSGDGNQGVWEFTHNAGRAGLTTTSAGNYTFTLNYGQDLSINYNYLVGVRYPESTGDFRVQYKDNVNGTWKTSVVIPAITEADTVSYFVRHSSSPYIRVQKCTATWDPDADEGRGVTTVTWANVNEGADILPDTISADGVFNFIFTKSGEDLVLSAVEPYTGNFYIRVDGAGSTNWDNYRAADHLMPFSEYSFAQTTNPFSHYFAQYYKTINDDGTSAGAKNIKFVVANDYSTNVSDTITQDGIADNYVDAEGWLSGRNANIRFMYNYKTNEATRRYLDGAQEEDSEFLLLIPSDDESIYNAATDGTPYTQVKFSDNGNWVYEANVYVVPGTEYKLRAIFGEGEGTTITQWLKGKESGEREYETLIGGSSGPRLQIRLLYDFKTNRLVTGYVPSTTIDADIELNADIMFVREHQGNVTQITFGEGNQISAIQNVYSTLKFNKSTINNSALSRYERDLYYVSFPYDVSVSAIIGFGTYGKHWIIEYYDGAARAEKGYWADSPSFWKFVTPSMKNNFTLKAGTGYIVALDLDELGNDSKIWDNTETVELIFPGDINSISNQEVTYTLPQHQCNINRGTTDGDRRVKDSHWNVLGVPAYHNTTGTFANHYDEIDGESQVWSADGKPNYLYTWNMTDNSLSVTNATGYNYKAMHAYMVQYYGTVTFHTSTNAAPAPIAARTHADAPSQVEFRMEIQQDETAIDQTFIKLSNDEDVSADFVFGEDMSKEFNKNKANVYTFIADVQAAGNTLPMSEQTTIVPVGVKLATDGDYTFAMPDGTSGVGVTLIDSYTGTHTNLSALDYTVSLEAGTYDDRFLLQISPIHTVTTDVETSEIRDQKSDVRKVLIDGLLYIVRDDKMFDARGARVE